MGFPPSPLPQPRRGQAWHVQQGNAKFRELELDISLLATGNFKNLWKIDIWAEEFFSRRRGLWIRCPQSAVHSLQSIVSMLCGLMLLALCSWRTDLSVDFSVSFRALWSQCFGKQKYHFPASKTPFFLIFKIWYMYGLRELSVARYFIWKWAEIFLEAQTCWHSYALNGLLHWRIFHRSLFK